MTKKIKYAVDVNINKKLICILYAVAETPEQAKEIVMKYITLDAKKDGKA